MLFDVGITSLFYCVLQLCSTFASGNPITLSLVLLVAQWVAGFSPGVPNLLLLRSLPINCLVAP